MVHTDTLSTECGNTASEGQNATHQSEPFTPVSEDAVLKCHEGEGKQRYRKNNRSIQPALHLKLTNVGDEVPGKDDGTGIFKVRDELFCQVYKEDILKVKTDCIVNPVNDAGTNGIATRIQRAFEITPEEVPDVGEQTAITKGQLGGYKAIINTMQPKWRDFLPHGKDDVARCEKAMKDSILGCFEKANSLWMTSIAIPACSGIFAISGDICRRAYVFAVTEYSQRYSSGTLKEIHFVDDNSDIVQQVRETFQKTFSKQQTPTYNINAWKMMKWRSLPDLLESPAEVDGIEPEVGENRSLSRTSSYPVLTTISLETSSTCCERKKTKKRNKIKKLKKACVIS